MIDRDVAERLAGRVIGALPPAREVWTNGSIGVSRDQVLVVWFMDED